MSAPRPRFRTRFIGRRDALERIRRLLEDHRLVTLTGAGGVGKTRIAARLADRVDADLAEEVGWIELAPLAEPGLVTEAVCSAMSVRVGAEVSPLEALVRRLRSTRSLLVLDNCEHLVEACADLVRDLLEQCPELRILTTSREALGVHGEVTFPVPSLSVPEPRPTANDPIRTARDHESVQLLVERIRLSLPQFELTEAVLPAIVDICRRLEGIPLALELAAARARSLAVEEIAARLERGLELLGDARREPSSRHRTMRAAIDWSHDLLPEKERALFRRLGAFGGGASLEACEAVCSTGGEAVRSAGEVTEAEILDLLTNLIDKSLVAVDRDEGVSRYLLLEPLRQYAEEKLEEAGESATVRARHAGFFLAFSEATAGGLRTADRPACLHRFEREHENVRRAWSWALEAGDFDTVGRLARALFWFWNFGGYFGEGRARSEEALARCPEESEAHIELLYTAGTLAWMQADLRAALPRLERCAALCRERKRGEFLGVALREQAGVMLTLGDLAAAADLYEESIARLRRSGATWDLALATVVLADVRSALGDEAGAEALLGKARALFREEGDPWGISLAQFSRAVSHGKAGRLDEARMHATEALELQRACGDLWNVGMTLTLLGEVTLHTGPPERAAQLLLEGLAAQHTVGDRASIAHGLLTLADVERQRGRTLRAVRLAGAGQAVSETFEGTHPYALGTEDQRSEMLQALRRVAGEEAFAEAWARGRAMTLDEAVAFAEERSGAGASSVPEAAEGEATLRVLLLGPPEVYRGRRRLRAADWGYALPRELLFYLLVNGPRTKEQIGLEFWPEASTEQLRGRFRTTLYHLRRAVGGTEWVRYDQGRYAFDRDLDYWLDVEAFEARLERADEAMEADPRAAAAHLESAVGLYRGDFLEGESVGRWASEHRGALRRRYVDALMTLGGLRASEGDHAAAAEHHRRVLSRDELHVAAHRELVRCLARAGDRTGALRHLDHYEDLLREELNAEPSEEDLTLRLRLEEGETV